MDQAAEAAYTWLFDPSCFSNVITTRFALRIQAIQKVVAVCMLRLRAHDTNLK